MNEASAPVDGRFHRAPIAGRAAKNPLHALPISAFLTQVAKHVRLPLVPQHGLASRQSERHIVEQGFERTGAPHRSRKIRMSPHPETAMPVSAVVALNAEAKRLPLKGLAVQRYPA